MSNTSIFISNGFLPLSDEVIRTYISSISFASHQSQSYVFHIFETLGYLSRFNDKYYKPTYKMINALIDTKYAAHLVIFENNSLTTQLYESPKYIYSLYELLKLIDFHIIETIERIIK